ncbi:YibE/F family protein [Dactylosporangium sp. AC04546]|uniref:YibE/F family protein n=1 Tax=Dactylosporangium sp. AC04546 TaxID=2862460 RepID=UPI001EE016FC|nr:YibE/F family protein [Dactylosporangium sp. AC04546]WVK86741.1 YibE/F family protein [Dactylosporangium sp. AC04546]
MVRDAQDRPLDDAERVRPADALVAHSHGAHGSVRLSRRAVRLSLAVIVPAGVLIVVAMALLWPRGGHPVDTGGGSTRASGEVRAVHHGPCPDADPAAAAAGTPSDCGSVQVRITDGPGRGQLVNSDIPAGPGAVQVKVGDRVVLVVTQDDSAAAPQYQIIDAQRGLQLWLLVACFAVAIIAFGRWRGVTAMAGLGVTFGVLLYFIVPAILAGKPPLLVAVVGCAAIMLAVLYLTHGLNTPTSVAVIGTLASLCLTGVLSQVATAAASLNGVAGEESSFLTLMYHDVDMRGLLLAGILIGSLGVLDDVAVTQAFTVAELSAANHTLGFAQLYRAASRIGRAHIASVVNTIVLAYAGASLPLLLLLAAGNQPLGEVLTSQLLAQEIVRSAVGTIGLIAAVPITTALAALIASRYHRHDPPPETPAREVAARRHAKPPLGTPAPSAAVPPRAHWTWGEPDAERP